MDGAFLSTRDLEPLLRGTWQGTGPAFACLGRQARLIGKAVGAVHQRCGGRRCPGYPEIRDLEHDTLLALMEKARDKYGLALPKGWTPRQNMVPWLFRVVQNQAISLIREVLAQKRGGDRVHTPIEDLFNLGVEGTQGKVADAQEAEQAKADAEDFVGSGPSAINALAWVLLRLPSALYRGLVERASVTDPRGSKETVHGLARDLDETWDLLLKWKPRHAADPDSSASRLELAWILRSTDRQSPEAWRAGAPDEVKTARDTLRVWENRFRKKLKAFLEDKG